MPCQSKSYRGDRCGKGRPSCLTRSDERDMDRNQLKCFFQQWFLFSLREQRSGFLLRSLNSTHKTNEKWHKQSKKLFSLEPTTIRSRRVWRFIVTEAKSLQGIILISYRTLKVPSVTNNMINSIHCLQTFSFDLFLRVSLYDVATQPLFWKFESLNSSVCWNMLISAGVASYPNLSEPEKHTQRGTSCFLLFVVSSTSHSHVSRAAKNTSDDIFWFSQIGGVRTDGVVLCRQQEAGSWAPRRGSSIRRRIKVL